MSRVDLTCSYCNSSFQKEKKEYNRRIKVGAHKFYCSLSCSMKANRIRPKTPHKAYGNSFNRKGKFTYYLHAARNRKQFDFDLDEEYLESIWTGKCVISNIDIHLKKPRSKPSPFSASLDRIDSTKGYVKGNVQFLAYSINLAKNSFSDDQIKTLLQEIADCYQHS